MFLILFYVSVTITLTQGDKGLKGSLCFRMPALSKFVAVGGTSNTRQINVLGLKGGNILHKKGHNCCIVGGDIDPRRAVEYISSILCIKVASYPGLEMQNWNSRKCGQDEFLDMKLYHFISWACQQEAFSGVLVLFLLCNDHVFFQETMNFSPAKTVRMFLDKLQHYLEKCSFVQNIRLLVLNTALFRQKDFDWPKSYREHKALFNWAFRSLQGQEGFALKVGGMEIPYTVIDLNHIVPEHGMMDTKYYCKEEVEKAFRYPGYRCVHVNARYMEQYLVQVSRVYQEHVGEATPAITAPPPAPMPPAPPSPTLPPKRKSRPHRKRAADLAACFGDIDLG